MRRAVTTLIACVFAMVAHGAWAQPAVSHIVVPFAAGGGQDVLARVIAPELGKALQTTFVIDNRAGAGGAVGTAYVARAEPNGGTLLMAASSHNYTAALDRNAPYDPIKDFTPVAQVGVGAYVLLINAGLPVQSVAELIAYAKARPGKLNYASAGVGSATHLAMASFASRAGVELAHVPFKSTAEAANSLIGGDTQVFIVPLLGSQAFTANPAIRVLAVVSSDRVAMMPDTPTVSESGLPGFTFTSWFGLLGPAAMASPMTEKINAAMNKVLAIPAVSSAIEQQGIRPDATTPVAFGATIKENYAQAKMIVEKLGFVSN